MTRSGESGVAGAGSGGRVDADWIEGWCDGLCACQELVENWMRGLISAADGRLC